MRRLFGEARFFLVAALVLTTPVTPAEIAKTDSAGRVVCLAKDGRFIQVLSDLYVALPGWTRQVHLTPWHISDLEYSESATERRWTGRLEVDEGKFCRYTEVITETTATIAVDLSVTAEVDLNIEGAFLFFSVPIAEFTGGTCEYFVQGVRTDQAILPAELPAAYHFLTGDADKVVYSDADHSVQLDLDLDRVRWFATQDDRQFGGRNYTSLTPLSSALGQNQTASIHFEIGATVSESTESVLLHLNEDEIRYQLDGFGGNYCFQVNSPVTDYTLENLRSAWARTEMKLIEWEPENDNESPSDTNWEYLQAHDTPGSNLRYDFLVARQIQQGSIPYVVSVWNLPEWLYEDPGVGPWVHGRRVDAAKWDEVLESIGSYLLYAKNTYGVEPDTFSFNEPNIGVNVLFSPEEHRDVTKRIGGHLESLGLKTRMLLADTSHPRGTHTYAGPTAEDADAMRYVGAVSTHSWGGAFAEEWALWGDLAESLGLPLLIGEVGLDPEAWRTPSVLNEYYYAIWELQLYQEILLFARPRGTMQWEFTEDYSLVNVEYPRQGRETLIPTKRFWFISQFCNLTPQQADALRTDSSSPQVLFSAFRSGAGSEACHTLHIANLGGDRTAVLTGIPAGLSSLRAFRTSELEDRRSLEPVPVVDGAAALNLAQQSLLTLAGESAFDASRALLLLH